MFLRHLALQNFRNFARLELDAGPEILLVQGANAQGKTNLLEAIYLLATTRAVRGSSEAELIRWNAAQDGLNAARLVGQAERRRGPVTVEVVIAGRDEGSGPSGASERASKRLKLNGVPRRASDVIGQIAAVLFTAADIELITGAPAGRRRYLDIMISQTDPAYVRALQRYARVLLQRNHLLRRIKDGDAKPEELGFWDAELIREGARIMYVRYGTMQALCIAARDYHRRLSYGREELQITYASQAPLQDGEEPVTTREIEKGLHAALGRMRKREIATGTTVVGPHRDDLLFRLDGRPIASYGSRAQQRTAALSLRFGEAAFLRASDQDPPILLLDDILSELDEARRQSVLGLLNDAEQVLVTTAEPDCIGGEIRAGARVLDVRGGTIAVAGSTRTTADALDAPDRSQASGA